MKKLLLFLMIAGVYILHQDNWNWKKTGFFLSSFPDWAKTLLASVHFINPDTGLVFGCLPSGLAYHVGYSVLAAIMMAVLVKFAWPAHLEQSEPHDANLEKKSEETRR